MKWKLIIISLYYSYSSCQWPSQLSGRAAEYTDCISVEGWDSSNKCPGYDTKQFDGESPVLLEFWGMQSTPSLPSLPDPLWPRVVAPDQVLLWIK